MNGSDSDNSSAVDYPPRPDFGMILGVIGYSFVSGSTEDLCSICHEPLGQGYLGLRCSNANTRHPLCMWCTYRWFLDPRAVQIERRRRSTCPVCRAEVMTLRHLRVLERRQHAAPALILPPVVPVVPAPAAHAAPAAPADPLVEPQAVEPPLDEVPLQGPTVVPAVIAALTGIAALAVLSAPAAPAASAAPAAPADPADPVVEPSVV